MESYYLDVVVEDTLQKYVDQVVVRYDNVLKRNNYFIIYPSIFTFQRHFHFFGVT